MLCFDSISANASGGKESGIGLEGSKYGVDDYVEVKYICAGALGKDARNKKARSLEKPRQRKEAE